MPVTLQVIYNAVEGAHFDYDYYLAHHLPLVQEQMGDILEGIEAVRGLASGPDIPPAYLMIATLTFPDMETLETAMAEKGGPVVDDVANFTNVQPQLLIGELLLG